MSVHAKPIPMFALEDKLENVSTQGKNVSPAVPRARIFKNRDKNDDVGDNSIYEDFEPSGMEYDRNSTRSALSISSRKNITAEVSNKETGASSSTLQSQKLKPYSRQENMCRKVKGLPYVTRTGVDKYGKVFSAISSCCKAECFKKIPLKVQQDLFNTFYSANSLSNQHIILKSGITLSPKKSSRINKGKVSFVKRNITATYEIYNKKLRKSHKVCKNFYIELFKVSRAKIDFIIEKAKSSMTGFVGEDRRGKSEPFNKLKEEERQQVLSHINSFPLYENCHYSDRHTGIKYLQGNLSIKKMFELYVQSMHDSNRKSICYDVYRKIFNTTGYKFKPPQIDSYKKCDEFHLKIKQENIDDGQKKEIKTDFDNHLDILMFALEEKPGNSSIQGKNVAPTTPSARIIENHNPNCDINYVGHNSRCEEDFEPSGTKYDPSSTSTLLILSSEKITADASNKVTGASSSTLRSLKSKPYSRQENMCRKVKGLPYLTRAGVEKYGKVFSAINGCCKAECFKKIPLKVQQNLFNTFYSESSLSNQHEILKSGISLSPKKSSRISKGKVSFVKRNITATYEIYNKKLQKSEKVCKNFYINLFKVSRAKIDFIIEKAKSSMTGFVGEDTRVKSEPFNKLKEEERQQVLSHINSFPLYESHNSSRPTGIKYLQGNLSIKKMFELYVQSMQDSKRKSISYDVYRKLFNTTGYEFEPPKIDIYQKRDEFN